MSGPCAGLFVLDLSRTLAGALTTMLLCDNGADVLLVEPPSGHPLRSEPGFLVWGRGKRSLQADLDDAGDLALVQSLAARAGVLIESFEPGQAQRLGLDRASLCRQNPRLVVCSMSAFGDSGPDAGLPNDDAIVTARVGIMGAQPGFRPGPVFVRPRIPSYGAALLAVQALGAALYARERDGAGRGFSVPLLHGGLAMQASHLLDVEHGEQFILNERTPLGGRPLYRLYQCQDGRWIHIGVLTPRFWPGVALATGHPEWISDPRFQTMPNLRTAADRAAFIAIMEAEIDRLPYAEWDRRFEEQDVPYAPSQTVDEFMRDPQVTAAGMLVEVQDPRVGTMQQPGLAVNFQRTPGTVRGPAPLLGQDDKLIPATASGWGSAAVASPPGPLSIGDGEGENGGEGEHEGPTPPFAGVRIIDFSSFIAGPLGPAFLVDLGADVIKVEAPEGDGLRPSNGFLAWNRGKRDIGLDLKRAEAREIIDRLVDSADVVIENMRPGVAERLGIDYETLRRRNPRLIYCSVTAYGPTGPYRHKPGFDPLMQARSGIERAQGGYQNPPVFLLVPITDNTAAMLNAAGIALALYEREHSGQGQKLETSLLRAACLVQSDSLVDYEGRPPRPANDQGQFGPHALYRLYQCIGGWIMLAAEEEWHWQPLAAATGHEQLLQDERFGPDQRRAHDSELAAILARHFAGQEVERCLEQLRQAEIPAVHVMESYAQRFVDDPHLLANDLIASYHHPAFGAIRQPAVLARFGAKPASATRPAPLLGEHTREILAEIGYDQAAIERFIESGVVVEAAP